MKGECPMSIETKTLIRRWFDEVWNRGNPAAIDEMLASNAVVHGLTFDLHGPAAFKEFQRAYRTAFPDIRLQVDEVVAEGDLVVARWSGSGTHRGDILGFAGTGKTVEFTGMAMGRIQGGKIVEGWNNFDQLGMLQQLGVVTLPAA
jgi:steroid delta-isomerase-like uncharacterized protein